MKLHTDHFQLEFPVDWEVVSHEGSAVNAKGSHDEQVKLSSVAISGQGSAHDLSIIRERVRANGIRAIETAAREYKMPITKPLSHNRLPNGFDIDEIECRSPERAALLCVITSKDAVLLLTYEAPRDDPDANPLADYAQIVNSIGRNVA
jgi:hypothetical protein